MAYINKMTTQKDLFMSLVAKVQQNGQQKQILATEISRYQIPSLKSEKMDCTSIKNIYSAIEYKYKESKELSEEPQGWNDNEKKLFIWIIIFFVYFLEKEGRQLITGDWDQISRMLFFKNPHFLRFQYLNLVKPQGKITWTIEEDSILNEAVETLEKGKWYEVSRYIFIKTNYSIFKSPKHCRERWLNHLDDHKKRGNWTPEEDLMIFKFVLENGKRWCKLVPVLEQTRTEHMIKNRYNSLINKQKLKRKETEDHLITKIIRQLKKQIANIQKRKLKKEEKVVNHQPNKQESSNYQEDQINIVKSQEAAKIQEQKQYMYKEFQEEEDQKAIQTPVSLNQSVKKEDWKQNEIIVSAQKDRYLPLAVNSCEQLPFYSFNHNIQDYPFLYEQQMQMMHYFYAYRPPV